MFTTEDARILAETNPKLSHLLPIINQMGWRYARPTGLDADEVANEIVLAILERQAKDPNFMNQTDSYILHAGRYAAWRQMDRNSTDAKYVADGDFDLMTEEIPDDELGIEEMLTRAEEAITLALAIEQLSDRERSVVTLAAAGITTGEMAQTFECSPAAISGYKSRAVRKLTGALALM